jgi:putative Mg2+ transporter-C (MgtC) family protein
LTLQKLTDIQAFEYVAPIWNPGVFIFKTIRETGRKNMISDVEIVGRLAMAAVLGGVIGGERERLSWAAGLRTHMLVAVGSSLVMITSAFGFADVLGTPGVSLDPSRIAAQVVSGIGFLGAGSILLRGEMIRGLTTAASLWTVAGVGLAVGGGLYTASIAATVIILVILAGIKPIERRFFTMRQRRELRLITDRGTVTVQALERSLGAASNRIKRFIVQPPEEAADTDEVSIALSRVSGQEFDEIRARLLRLKGVRQCIDQLGE